MLNGAFNKGQAGGVRIQGTSIWGVDWSLVYIYSATGETGTFDYQHIFSMIPKVQPVTAIYGDPGVVQTNVSRSASGGGPLKRDCGAVFSDGGKQA